MNSRECLYERPVKKNSRELTNDRKIYKPTKDCPYPSKGLFIKNGKLYDRVLDSRGVRDILIPDRTRNVQSTYFCRDTFNKISKYANEIQENKDELFLQMKKEENKLIEESAKRVEELRQYDKDKNKAKSSYRGEDLQEEDNAIADYTNKRAKELLLNQKDEMKMCNKFIMEAKCQQIRKDQIEEKELIKQELKKLQIQENEVMIQALYENSGASDKEKEMLEKKKKQFIEGINSQIKENELRHTIEQEQLAQEGRLNLEASCQEMINALEERNRKKMEHFENMKKINDYNKNVIKYMKAVENEESIIEDRKIKEYHEEKERKENEMLAEKQRIEKEKQKIRDIIISKQMKIKQDDETRAQMHAQYVQDLVERQWRQKEREALEKKIRDRREMMEGRERQRRLKNELMAAETVAAREDFNARLKVFDDLRQKEKEEEEARKAAAIKHRLELINQINDRETQAIEEKKKKFMEAQELRDRREAEMKEIRDHLERKIQTLREYNLPESTLADIKRRLKQHKFL